MCNSSFPPRTKNKLHRKIQIAVVYCPALKKNDNPQVNSNEMRSDVCQKYESYDRLEILLLKTNVERGSFWQNITGSVEGRESFLAAAKRELFEETGIQISNITPSKHNSSIKLIDLRTTFKFQDRWQRVVEEHSFLCLLNRKPEKIYLDQHEHSDFKWVDFSKLCTHDYKYPSNYQVACAAVKKIAKLTKLNLQLPMLGLWLLMLFALSKMLFTNGNTFVGHTWAAVPITNNNEVGTPIKFNSDDSVVVGITKNALIWRVDNSKVYRLSGPRIVRIYNRPVPLQTIHYNNHSEHFVYIVDSKSSVPTYKVSAIYLIDLKSVTDLQNYQGETSAEVVNSEYSAKYSKLDDRISRTTGRVSVYEAPIYERPDTTSKIIERITKGKVIYIHPQHFSKLNNMTLDGLPLKNKKNSLLFFNNQETKDNLDNISGKEEFYTTITTNGQTAYIPQKYVNLIFNDSEELDKNLFSSSQTHKEIDNTDYRLVEPLPEKFPFEKITNWQLQIFLGVQNSLRRGYPFPTSFRIVNQKYNPPWDMGLGVTYHSLSDYPYKLVEVNKNWEWNWGGLFILNSYHNRYQFENGTLTEESNFKLALGPLMMTTFYRNKNNKFAWTFYISPLYYFYDKFNVQKVEITSSFRDSRRYSDTYLAVRSGIWYQQLRMFSNLNLLAGLYLQFNPAHLAETIDPAYGKTGVWKEIPFSDTINNRLEIKIGAALGIQSI